MSRVVVIGASGHIGSYLVPRLVRAGHDVVAVSRGTQEPYHRSIEWQAVERVTAAREAAEATKELQARRGRASYTGERSIGSVDAGAIAVAVLAEAVAAGRADRKY